MVLPYQLRTDSRPWGQFIQFTQNQETTVKLIEVLPGGKLSTQRHKFRDEFWVALDSGLRATLGNEIQVFEPGAHLYVPRNTIHSMENIGDGPARFLEISFGQFNEQDIERLEDKYGRVNHG